MERDRPEATPPTLEALFLRWREEDDAEALGEMLARTEAELIVVARRQARDDAAAWDLVQEAWVTVLREGHKWDSSQRLMPWLVGILTICARRARRVDARTPDPERLAQREVALPDAAVPAEEVRTLIERGLGNVSTLYGDVVRMHLFEEMTHAEIAERTGREPGTVRVQVFRGLAQLRKHLPSSLSLGVAILALAPRSEAARLAPVLDTAFGSGPAIGAGTATVSATTGASWIAAGALRWWLAAAAVATVAGGVWWATAGPNRRDVEHASVPAVQVAPDVPAPTPLASGPENVSRSVASAEAALETASVPRPGVWLVGTVADLDRLPRATTTITLRAGGVRSPPMTERLDLTGRRDETARFEIDLTAWYAGNAAAPRDFIALLDHPYALPARSPHWLADEPFAAARAAAAAGSTQRLEIPARFDLVLPVARVHGRVTTAVDLDPALRAADAVVGLFEIDARGNPAPEPIEGSRVRADGTFTLRAARIGPHRIVAALSGAGARPADAALHLAPAQERETGELVLEPGAEIAGRVVSARAGSDRVSWRPIEKSETRSVHGVPLAWTGARFETHAGEFESAADGTFRIAGLAQAEYVLSAQRSFRDGPPSIPLDDFGFGDQAGNRVTNEARIFAPAQGILLRTSEFDVPLTVTGSGAPLGKALVERLFEGGGSQGCSTDDQGRASLRTSGPPGVVRLRVSKTGWIASVLELSPDRLDAQVGVHVDLAPGLAPAEIVLEAGSMPLDGCDLLIAPWDAIDAAGWESVRTLGVPPMVEGFTTRKVLEGGRLNQPLDAGHWCVVLHVPQQGASAALSYVRPTLIELDLAPGADIRRHVELELGGRLRFQPIPAVAGVANVQLAFERAAGERVSLPLSSLEQRGDGRQGRRSTTDRLAFGVGAESALLEPGSYTLRTTIGPNTSTRTVEMRAGETTVIE